PDSGGNQRKSQRVGSVADPDAVPSLAKAGERFFKLLNNRAAHKTCRRQRASEDIAQFFFEFRMNRSQIQERYSAHLLPRVQRANRRLVTRKAPFLYHSANVPLPRAFLLLSNLPRRR